MKSTCNYSINELPCFTLMQRPFVCPPQINVYFFKEPPLFSFQRCNRHKVYTPDDSCCCNPQEQVQIQLRVGDCPRCFQQLRAKLRPEYQGRMKQLQEKFKGNVQQAEKTMQQIVRQNRELQKELSEKYNAYEEEVRKAVKKFQEAQREECQRLKKKKK